MITASQFRDRKERELRFKLSSLPLELEKWRARATNHQPLAKNHSQIERVTYRIEGFQSKVELELGAAVKSGDLWRQANSIEKKALMVHMVWDFFRTRFGLRTIPPFDRYLALADAFARSCYEPAIRLLKGIAKDRLCPAPLVSFNEQISPWAAPEDAVAGDENSDALVAQLTAAIQSMPLALLGVPWSYLTYLPHMALLAHEVGHAVEHDGELNVSAAVEEANLEASERKTAWQAWKEEVFADVFACWMGGPAFVWSLADYLASDETSIAKQTRPQINGEWTKYPTASLRVRFCCQILERRGFEEEAAAIRESWKDAYPNYQLSEFERDFNEISSRMEEAGRMKAIQGTFQPALYTTARRNAGRLEAGGNLQDDPQLPQCYIATARLLMQAGMLDTKVTELWDKLVEHHLQTRSPELAAGVKVTEAIVNPDDERREGAYLAELF